VAILSTLLLLGLAFNSNIISFEIGVPTQQLLLEKRFVQVQKRNIFSRRPRFEPELEHHVN
jgi:hypothetical protein